MYCVVLGDIINSKQINAENVDEVTSSIKETLNYINTTYMDSILADFGLVRGDAFEGVLLTHYQIPMIINEIIKGLYRIQQTRVRICIVIDELTSISTDRNEANGPAFYKASEAIERMKAVKNNHWFQVSIITSSYAQPLLNGILSLISSITKEWTDRQREIVWAVEELSEQQSLVSKKFGISPSVVNKQLKAANYHAYRKAWQSIEEFLINMEENTLQQEKCFLAYYGTAQRYNKRNRYQEAVHMLLKSLEIAKEALDEGNPQLILIYNSLADNLIKLDRYEEAEKYLDLSLEAQQDLPKSRLIYAATLNILGDICLSRNILPRARDAYLTALDIAVNTVGSNHYYTSLCHNKLAAVYRHEENYEEAILYYKKNLTFLRQHPHHKPTALADVLYQLASCYHDQGDDENAKKSIEEALLIYQDHLPPKNELIKKAKELCEEIEAGR
jgi:tetratricopeptide (TPR) repeat protein